MARGRLSERLVERSVAPAREKSADELGRILDAAEAVLARGGYDGLRVDDVLDAAGLSTRAFYRHFRGKSELFVALIDREMAQANDRLRSRLRRAGAPEDQVRAWVSATIALAYDPRLAARTRLFFVGNETLATEFPSELERCVRMLLEPLEEAIAAGVDAGVFRTADPEADAVAIHHLCTGLMSDRLMGTGSMSRDRAVALAERFALAALESDTRPRRRRLRRPTSQEPELARATRGIEE